MTEHGRPSSKPVGAGLALQLRQQLKDGQPERRVVVGQHHATEQGQHLAAGLVRCCPGRKPSDNLAL